jgi:hypothetical protein
MLYTAELTKAGVKAPVTASSCPTNAAKGQYFKSCIAYPHAYPGAAYILQPPPYSAAQFPNNAWVEVIHGTGRGVSNDERVGAWFYYLKGSGIWYNLGVAKSYADHKDSWADLHSHGGGGLTTDEAMCKAAVAKGYDSVIYLNHHDIGTCPSCCSHIHQNTILVEIVAVKLVGKYACAGPGGNGVKSGWMGSKPCKCNACGSNCFINCQGVPQFTFSDVSEYMLGLGNYANYSNELIAI